MDLTALDRLQLEVEKKRSELEEREKKASGIKSAIVSGKLLAYEDTLRMIAGVKWQEETK